MSNGFEALAPYAADIKQKARDKAAQDEKEHKARQKIASETEQFLRTMRKTGVKSASSLRLSSSLDEKDIDFAKAMKMAGVEPLDAQKRVQHPRKSAAPIPSQTIADNRQVLEDSLSDELDSVEFLESEDGLAFRRPGVGPDVPRDLRRGRWSVVGQLDLHGMFVDEARDAVAKFHKNAQATERLCVRIIHGKGNGSPNRQPILREKVRRWLKQRDEVIAFAEPRENDGGAGATLVRLRPQKRH